MMKRNLTVFLLITCLLKLNAEPLKVSTQAPSAILMNAENGAILYEKNARELRFPASITKVATALYVIEKMKGKMEEVVQVTADSLLSMKASIRQSDFLKYPAYRLEHDGSMMGIKVGEQLSIRVLLYGLLLSSGNDAANVLAKHCSGSVEQFMNELNQYLHNQGLVLTHFSNPHGLLHPEHVTSAYEMAKITQLAIKSTLFREIVKTVKFNTPATNLQPEGALVQHNRLLLAGKYFYPKAIGVKTGYVQKAGHNLVAAAEHQGRTLIAVLMGYTDPMQRFQDAIHLFETAFKEKKLSRLLFTEKYDLFSKKISGAKELLHARLKEDLQIEYFASEEPELRAVLRWAPCSLPIKKGDVVGTIQLYKNQETNQFYSIYADHDVEKTIWKRILDWMGILTHPLFLVSLIVAAALGATLYFFRREVQE